LQWSIDIPENLLVCSEIITIKKTKFSITVLQQIQDIKC